MKELSVIQKTYDLLKWYIPIIDRFPRKHKFTLGDRIINRLYDLLEGFIEAKYTKYKLKKLKTSNIHLDVLRYQTKLLLDLEFISLQRYEYINQLLDEIGVELGGWIRNQETRQ